MKIAIAGATGVVGQHVVQAAQARGHDPVRLARSEGVDLTTTGGLEQALEGVDVIVDVVNAGSLEQEAASRFFTEVGGNLHLVGHARGVAHLVTLSIVGIDQLSVGYYAAKLEQERAAASGPIPNTILRATQFHEFPAQQLSLTREGDQASVLDLAVQTVAARSVAENLVQVSEQAPVGRAPDLAGPAPERLVDLARRFAARHAPTIEVVPDRETAAGLPDDALLPSQSARIAGPTFDEWLESGDASAVAP